MMSMHNSKLAVITLISLVVLLLLHVYGMSQHWYLYFPFFDLITHFLGGMGIALSALYVLKNPKHIIWITILAGIVWEIFEVYFDIMGWPVSSRAYKIDTAIDIVMDTLGALVVWFVANRKK
jgi:VanZ family protein